jgi:hypothetical protein
MKADLNWGGKMDAVGEVSNDDFDSSLDQCQAEVVDLPAHLLSAIGGGCHICHQIRIDK